MTRLCLSIQPGSAVAPVLGRSLQEAGYKAYRATSWPSALRALSQWNFDLVVLEPKGVPGDPGETMARLHELHVPLVLSDTGLEPRPFFWPGLGPTAARAPKSAGGLRLDPRGARASYQGRELGLTRCEFELLFMLVDSGGEFVSRAALAAVLRERDGGGRRSTDMHISRLRKKLRDHGATGVSVRTVHGHGYCATVEEEPAEAPRESRARGAEASSTPWPRPASWSPATVLAEHG